MYYTTCINREQFHEVENLFLEAARLFPENVDIDVQVILAVIYLYINFKSIIYL